ncbi:MAG: glycosyltransferase family 2 protein [Alphaproteobacteria bacterium]|nr:glycosyltransferase family 2 protein [Alphaproteobacteria bacterium]
MTPFISIIIPTYNRANTLGNALHSLTQQSFQDFEIIIVDDGSADKTKSVIKEFQQKNLQHKIIYVSQDNQGPAIARNTGVEHARADIIVYLDSDDRLYSSALEDIAWVLKDPKVLYGITNHNRTIRLLDKAGDEIARKFDVSGINKSATLEQICDWDIKITSSGLFHRKQLFDDGVRWRSGFWIEDLEFMLQLAAVAPSGFMHIPKVLVDYVQTYGGDGLCSNSSYNDWAHAFSSIYELHKNDPLMKNPNAYLDRIEKYKELHAQVLKGKTPPPQYKYFPEVYGRNEQ